MTDSLSGTTPGTALSPRERSQLIARALSDAARRARFSTRSRKTLGAGGFKARRGQRLVRIILMVTFALMVVVPSVATAIYYGLIASDQYVAEARFTVRGGLQPKPDSLGALTGVPSIQIIQDTQVIMNYIQSRALIEALDAKIGLRALYSGDEVDSFSRLDPKKPIEKILKYWKSMIDVSVQMPSGIVVMSVRAFTPQDSVRIANAILTESENLVNDMNDRMRNDAVAFSLVEQKRANEQLAVARTALEQARNTEGTLSAEASAEAINVLIASVKSDLIKMQQEYEAQRRYVSETAPQMRSMQTRINAANQQVAFLQSKLTVTTGSDGKEPVVSASMKKLDYLEFQRKVAENIYAAATVAAERARIVSESKLMYINAFVAPVAPEEARYPHRLFTTILIFGGALAAWGALSGLLVVARNHMA
jgi:capsular polysaccharide transport system permease protein